MLYKELYYRHIYASVQGGPSLGQRFESYYNYCALFNYILSPPGGQDEPVTLELPNLWLWDIIDEFIYQFQQFAQYRQVNRGSRIRGKKKNFPSKNYTNTILDSVRIYIKSLFHVIYW